MNIETTPIFNGRQWDMHISGSMRELQSCIDPDIISARVRQEVISRISDAVMNIIGEPIKQAIRDSLTPAQKDKNDETR